MDVLIPAGIAIYTVGWLKVVFVAFRKSTRWGILTLLIPIVGVYYFFIRIEQTIRFGVVMLVGLVLLMVGAWFS